MQGHMAKASSKDFLNFSTYKGLSLLEWEDIHLKAGPHNQLSHSFAQQGSALPLLQQAWKAIQAFIGAQGFSLCLFSA